MPDRPGVFPDFNLNLTDAASPSPSEENDGWALDVQPDRQIFNHLWHYYGQWIRWLDQTQSRANDLLDNNEIIDPNTTIPAEFSDTTTDPPSWSGTRSTTVPAAWFSGSATVNGFRMGPVDYPGATFTDERDVYIDLDEDGSWVTTEVSNGDPEPGVGAGRVRFFRFVTDALSQITDGEYRADGSFTKVAGPPKFVSGASVDFAGITIPPISDDTAIHVIHDSADQIAGNYNNPAGAAGRCILMGTGETPGNLVGDDSPWIAIGINCRVSSSVPEYAWANRDPSRDSILVVFHSDGMTILNHDSTQGATWGNTIALADWIINGSFGRNTGVSQPQLQVDQNGGATTNHFVPTDLAPVTVAGLSARIWADSITQVAMRVVPDGAGSFSTTSGFGATVSIAGTAVRFTFQRDFASADSYSVTLGSNAVAEGTVLLQETNRFADRIDVLAVDSATGNTIDLSAVDDVSISIHAIGELA